MLFSIFLKKFTLFSFHYEWTPEDQSPKKANDSYLLNLSMALVAITGIEVVIIYVKPIGGLQLLASYFNLHYSSA